jgi:hypothetical protein
VAGVVGRQLKQRGIKSEGRGSGIACPEGEVKGDIRCQTVAGVSGRVNTDQVCDVRTHVDMVTAVGVRVSRTHTQSITD